MKHLGKVINKFMRYFQQLQNFSTSIYRFFYLTGKGENQWGFSPLMIGNEL